MRTEALAVSVVIPAWNAEDTIAETLDSLLAQTHGPWEAIVVDDGSSDATPTIVRDYARRDARFRLLQQERGGEAAARNAGLALAEFDWLLFLDGDDWIAPSFLARMSATLREDETLDAVHCRYARVTPQGIHVVDEYEPPEGDMFATWARRSAFAVHACVVRRAIVDEVGGFDASLEKSSDWDLWQRVARTGARFGAVRETLVFYRMRPSSASLEAPQMFRDGLRVLRRGHAPDPRVPRPHPDHVDGASPDGVRTQAWYLLSWCAGLMIGREQDPGVLIEQCDVEPFPELHAASVAQSLWAAAPLPSCATSEIWTTLWPKVHQLVRMFLDHLERASGAEGLANDAYDALVRKVLAGMPALAHAAERLDAAEAERKQLRGDLTWRDERIRELKAAIFDGEARVRSAELARVGLEDQAQEAERSLAERAARIRELEEALSREGKRARDLERDVAARETRIRTLADDVANREARIRDLDESVVSHAARAAEMTDRIARLSSEARALAEAREQVTAERNALEASIERRAGAFLLDRLHLRRPVLRGASVMTRWAQKAVLARLALERAVRPKRRRLLTTVCWNFPIHSQTFVYQELTHLMARGFSTRLIYSKIEPRDQLPDQYSHLWSARRRLHLNRAMHERDYLWYRGRMEGRVEELIERLCVASGMPRDRLVSHGNFLEAFTFTRMVEAYRPHYLHSYFFYDRSLMTLVAAYLLRIPRGVSCYADHVLRDYPLKVVPLHMELCDVVIATSERIRQELIELAPEVDPSKILIKPNGIDPGRFPFVERPEPRNGQPFRVVSVCRIEPKKGLLDLVDAMHVLRERGIAVEAHLVGAPDEWSAASVEYARRLWKRIEELGLEGVVHLEGRHGLEGVLKFHRQAHLFVAPFVETESGDKDGIPTALLEGMSGGLPAVATDAGSIREVVMPEHDGLLVQQRQPEALAAAIEGLLSDPAKRARLGRNAANTVRERFAADSLETLFHEKVEELLRR